VAADFINSFDPKIPFLSANIDASGEPALQALVDEDLIAGSTIIELEDTKVGVIGAITPRLPNISSPRNATVDADVAGAIADEVAALEAEGIDRIILISHLQGLSEDKELLPQIEGVDVVIAGGGDELLKNDGNTCMPDEDAADAYPIILEDSTGRQVPLVTGPGGYRCIGRLNVTFSDGVVSRVSGESIGVAIDGTADADIVSNVETPITEAVAGLTSNVLGTSEVDLDGQRSSVRTMTSNEGSLLADALLGAGQRYADDFGVTAPVVAIQNGGGIRNDAVISAGDFTEADTFDIAPFSNFVVVTEVPRERFKELLENAVAGLPDAEGFFPQPAGFTMTIDPDAAAREVNRDGECELTGDEGSRVVDVTLSDGTKIVEDGAVVDGDSISMATIDFLARGGDCYPLGDLDFTRVGLSYQQALAEHVETGLNGTISAADYPADGTNRIITVDDAAGSDDDTDTGATDDGDTDDTDDAAAEPTSTPMPDPTPTPTPVPDAEDLAETGLGDNALPLAIAAVFVVLAGLWLGTEGRRMLWGDILRDD